MHPPNIEKEEHAAVAKLIGWQLYKASLATHIELEQWERCVRWAREDRDERRKPYVPVRVCIPWEAYRKICNGKD